ncbi:hypothetical protein K1719_030159 [Acacia pycnantha]|nr:hypothetical protein K1719_030159 [Acacia pycnantha]
MASEYYRKLHTRDDSVQSVEDWPKDFPPLQAEHVEILHRQDWLHWNATRSLGKARFRKWTWTRIFAHVCWLLWKARCVELFDGKTTTPKEVVYQCQHHLREEAVAGRLKHQLFFSITQIGIHWEKPTPGYVRLDVHVSTRDHNPATVGGLIRDDRGRWVRGFTKSIGTFLVAVVHVLTIKTELEVCQLYKFQ